MSKMAFFESLSEKLPQRIIGDIVDKFQLTGIFPFLTWFWYFNIFKISNFGIIPITGNNSIL